MQEKTIVLSENLTTRRRQLEGELSLVIEAQLQANLQDELKGLLNKAGFTEGTATVEWSFYSQYDDEGGYDKLPTDYELSVNGESIDIEEYDEEDEDSIYLLDYLADILGSYSEDLYKEYVTSVDVKLD
jgi:hypothetical protein